MLSRVADSLYWINRYIERAENISRFLEVSEAMALDCPPGSAEPWLPLVDAIGDRDSFEQMYSQGSPKEVVSFLLRDRADPNRIVSCIASARENARQIRDVITPVGTPVRVRDEMATPNSGMSFMPCGDLLQCGEISAPRTPKQRRQSVGVSGWKARSRACVTRTAIMRKHGMLFLKRSKRS